MKKLKLLIAFAVAFVISICCNFTQAQNVFYVDATTNYVLPGHFNPMPVGGDTIKIRSNRTESLKFKGFTGLQDRPIVFINDGGQVNIITNAWGALSFEDCKYIKISGKGDPAVYYGFKLQGATSGLSFLENSSNCEAEFIEILGSATTFFGIYAKKDFSANPPVPYPVFSSLCIHDTYIHDLAEGMYIGETVSPGMEFKHLRIYNNVVVNTLRESVQIANCVEDVEIYNNIFLNAGLENLYAQNNGLQIGNNSKAKVYNNLIINSPAFGIIVLGNQDISLNNNFIQTSQGIFIDDRYTVFPFIPFRIEENLFSQINNTQIIENRNEFVDLFIKNNTYNQAIPFFKNSVSTTGILELTGNQITEIPQFQFRLENGIFINSITNPPIYQSIGPKTGLTHIFNQAPVIQPIEDILLIHSTSHTVNIQASATDFDILHFESRNLPDFAQLIEISAGLAELRLNPLPEHVGVYDIGIMVYDESHQEYARQKVQLSVMNPDNIPPVLYFDTTLNLEAASKFQLDITAFDGNNDNIVYSVNPIPAFARTFLSNGKMLLDLQPKLSDIGQYIINVVADDGYGNPANRELRLNVNPVILESGRVLYRVNFGGPEIIAEPINWQADIGSTPVYGTTYFLRTGSWSWTGTNTTSAPNNLFGPFRYDVAGGTEMQYAFPLSANGRYGIKLFFAERSTEVLANLTATFNIFLENEKVLDAFNIYQYSQYQAVEKYFEILVSDQLLNLNFQQIVNNPKINGIEIIYLGEEKQNTAPQVQEIHPIILNENDILTIPLTILDDEFESCNSINLILESNVDFVSIQEIESQFSLLIQPDYSNSGLYENLKLIVSDGCSSSAVYFSIEVIDSNRLPVLSPIENMVLQAGSSLNTYIQALDADEDLLSFQLINAPYFIRIIDSLNGIARLQLAPGIADHGNYVCEIKVYDNKGDSDSQSFDIQILAAPVSERIILKSTMIKDLVTGGSRETPLYLIDEQNLNPLENQHPKSKSWIPAKTASINNYQVQFDLGQEYYIDFAYLHDMQFIDDLNIYIGLPDNWSKISTYSTSLFKNWSKIGIKSFSRYLLLEMKNSILAQINELALYGFAPNATIKSNLTQTPDKATRICIYPNPARQTIYITDKSEDQIVEILNSLGTVVLISRENNIEIGQLPNGIYLLRVLDKKNAIFNGKFIKKD